MGEVIDYTMFNYCFVCNRTMSLTVDHPIQCIRNCGRSDVEPVPPEEWYQ